MNQVKSIKNLGRRLEMMERVISDAAGGNLYARIPLDRTNFDRLTVVEIGINLIISDLETETSSMLNMAEQLMELSKEK
ncbi:hypothetical protein JXM67_05950 [candidate division WOR-3 bacterium]|nr:hypothetical protein [candidate division WOR-3 bacterium]